MRPAMLTFAASMLLAVCSPAQEGQSSNPPTTAQEPGKAGDTVPDDAPEVTLEQALAKFHPVRGTAKLGTWAEAKLPEDWLFLGSADGRRFLTQLGNQPGPEVLGVVLPADFADSNVFAVYSYADEGHVKDDDAPDFDALLKDMREASAEQSKERQKAGLGTVELLGWAEPPHYDKTQHKLFWAEKLQFGENEGVTLNYNVRVLGRSGHLVVNGVGDIDQLALVAEHSKVLLEVTEFVDGQRYTDFDPAYDKVAAYGIGGLIAGKIALKVGLFAKLLGSLKLLWKPIAVGIAAIGAFLVRIFKGKKESEAKPVA